MSSLHFVPPVGEPLWAGWMTGKSPKSASVTAEAGKLPTLRVRPFCPFQVVVSGLWEEELVRGTGSGRMAAGLGPHSAHQAVSGHICLEEGKPFSLQHKKGTVGQAGLQQGGWDCAGVQGAVGKRKDPQDQHSRS